MGRPNSRLRTLVGPRTPAAPAPWKASAPPQAASGDTQSSAGTPLPVVPGQSASVILDADTELGVLMQALLGTGDVTDSLRARQSADVESRLAAVLADVGLSPTAPTRGAEPVATTPRTGTADRRRPFPQAVSTHSALGSIPSTGHESDLPSLRRRSDLNGSPLLERVRREPASRTSTRGAFEALPGLSPSVAERLAWSSQRPSAGLRQWIWVAVPVLLAVLLAGTWLTTGRGEARRASPSSVRDPLQLNR